MMKDTTKREHLQKLITGKISANELHHLEREALDDPFLFEALEGYANRTSDEELLLYHRPATTKKFSIIKMSAIAATILVLVSSMFLLNDNNKKSQKEPSIVVRETVKRETVDTGNSLSNVYKASQDVAVYMDQGPKKVEEEAEVIKQDSPPDLYAIEDSLYHIDEIVVVGFATTQAKQISGSVSGIDEIESPIILKIETIAEDSTLITSLGDQNPTFSTTDERTANDLFIFGTVVDPDGEPLIGASIACAESTDGTVTDIDGTFSLKKTQDCNSIIVSFTGFESEMIDIGNSNQHVIQLQESQLLDEVVVTGYSTRHQYVPPPKTYGVATPDIGNEKLIDIVRTQIDTSICSISKIVNLEIIVKRNGNLGIITFDTDIPKACKKEIRNILKDSGTWTSDPPHKRTRIKYSISIK